MKRAWLAITAAVGLVTGQAFAAGGTTNPAPVKVHIAPFTDATGGKVWSGIDAALRDILVSAVSREAGVALLDHEHLDMLLREQKLVFRDLVDPASAARIGKLLGAERLVTGTVMLPDGQILVTAHVLDIESATVIKTCQARGRPEDLLDLTIDLGRQVAEALKLPYHPAINLAIDAKPVASLHFLRGLGFYHAGNADAAIMEFMTCLDVAPDHPAVRYWLGQCYYQLNEIAHATIEFDHFLADFPAAPEAADARARLAELPKLPPEDGAKPDSTVKAGVTP